MGAKELLHWYKDCIEFSDNRSRIVLKDDRGKSEFKVNNSSSKRVIAIRVDGCIPIVGKKCDYLLVVCNDTKCQNQDLYFIELKGSDLIKAINQINSTIELLGDKLVACNSVSGRIILTRYNAPNLKNNPVYKRLNDRLKRLNGNLYYKENWTEQI